MSATAQRPAQPSAPDAPPPSQDEQPEDQQRGRWWTLVAVSVAIFMLLVDVTIVNVALPDIEADLGSSFADLQWVIDAYALTLAAFLLTAGSLGDRVGRRVVFVVGIALFSAASLGCGLATSPGALTTFRALQGVGGAIMFATSLALLAAAYRGRDRGTAFGVYGAVTGASSAVGPLLGGALVSGLSWRAIFFVNVPVGIVAVVVSLTRLKESRSPVSGAMDVPGVLTFSAGLALLVFALIRGTAQGWTSAATVAELVGAVVLLALFVVVERRGADPMLDLSLFRVPAFVGAQVAAFTISAGLFALFLYLVLYLQNVLGYSALATGARLLAVSAVALVVAPIAGRLTATRPYRVLIGTGLALLTVGLLLMVRVDASSTWTVLLPGLLLAGAGVGMVNAPLGALAVAVVDPRRAGMASGVNSTARQVGIAVGTAVYGAIFTTHVASGVDGALTGARLPAAAVAGIDDAVSSGAIERVVASLPAPLRDGFRSAALETFTSGLSLVLLLAAVLVAVGAVACFALIRQEDLVGVGAPAPRPAGTGADAVPEASGTGDVPAAVGDLAGSSTVQEQRIAASVAEDTTEESDMDESTSIPSNGDQVAWTADAPVDRGPASAPAPGSVSVSSPGGSPVTVSTPGPDGVTISVDGMTITVVTHGSTPAVQVTLGGR